MNAQTFTFESDGGLAIFAYKWMPEDASSIKAIVQIHHGMAEHAARYARVAEALVGAGYGVYASDHRGHGKTAAGPEALGFFAEAGGWDKVVQDMHRLNNIIREAHPGLPVVMLAHSMGSFLARHYATIYGDTLTALALSGSNGPVGLLADAGRMVASVERRRVGPRGRSAVLQKMSFGNYNNAFKPNRTEFDWLSRDEAEVDLYINDPLCGFDVTVSLWLDLLGGLRLVEDVERQRRVPGDLPIYIFGGELDPVGGAKGLDKLKRLYRSAGLSNITLKVYPQARHEILNETNRDEVTADLIAWMDHAVG